RRFIQARASEEIADDLRVGPAPEVVTVDRARGAIDVAHRLIECPPPRSAGAEQGPVDVEQDELHNPLRPGLTREGTPLEGARRSAEAPPGPDRPRRRSSSARA